MSVDNLPCASAIRHRRLWLSLGWALVLCVVFLSLTPAPVQVPVTGGDKLGHLLAYGSMMIWFSNLHANLRSRVLLAIGFAAMGVALEFVQGWTGYRTFDIADMAANAAGVLAGWALAPPRAPNFLRYIETLFIFRNMS